VEWRLLTATPQSLGVAGGRKPSVPLWLAVDPPYEVVVAGDQAAPFPDRSALAERAVSQIDSIGAAARAALREAATDSGSPWAFEGMEFDATVHADCARLLFHRESDPYGFWFVTVREKDGRFQVVKVEREQR
jgi:hypothetical protein